MKKIPLKGDVLTVKDLQEARKMLFAEKPTKYYAIGIPIRDNKVLVSGVELDIVGEGRDEVGNMFYKVQLGDIELGELPVYPSYRIG